MAIGVERFCEQEQLDSNAVLEMTLQFHALCQGLASIELQGLMGGFDEPEQVWSKGLDALLGGLVSVWA